jgi:hypothetical protein
MRVGDGYISNNGFGPLRARIESIADGKVYLVRTKSKKADFKVRFTLPERFFKSSSCGWKRTDAAGDDEGGGR